jgi:small subunit ribosomal protein S1
MTTGQRSPILVQQFGRHTPWMTVLEDYCIGQDVKASVVGSIEYGMIVKLRTGIKALLQRREIDWTSIEPMQVLQIGESVAVRIISIDADRQRMGVSRKVLLPNPKKAFLESAQVGEIHVGTVKKCREYGIIVEIFAGVCGLIHIGEIVGNTQKIQAEIDCTPGDQIRVCIISIDYINLRIKLAKINE